MKSRVGLLQEPLGLHDPRCGFMLAVERGDCSELATCRRHLDTERAIAAGRCTECRDGHTSHYVVSLLIGNMINSIDEWNI
jgi:hypothetical protein